MAVWAKATRLAGLAALLCAVSARTEEPFRGGAVARTIVDPSTGQRWALFSDPAHPGGPGRWKPMASGTVGVSASTAKPVCVIRAGDRIVVQEHTGAVDLNLEAVAMNRAAEGEPVRARLKMGGAMVMARAGCNSSAALTERAGR